MCLQGINQNDTGKPTFCSCQFLNSCSMLIKKYIINYKPFLDNHDGKFLKGTTKLCVSFSKKSLAIYLKDFFLSLDNCSNMQKHLYGSSDKLSSLWHNCAHAYLFFLYLFFVRQWTYSHTCHIQFFINGMVINIQIPFERFNNILVQLYMMKKESNSEKNFFETQVISNLLYMRNFV